MPPPLSLAQVLSRTNPPITLTKLTSNCSIYVPTLNSLSTSTFAVTASIHPSPPTTILFLAWMDAAAKHTAKYIATYAALYPQARILVATITQMDFFMTSDRTRTKTLAPLLYALTDDPAPSPKLLIHLFSNGGAKTLFSISTTYHAQTGSPLPATLLVADSAPGRPHFFRDVYALTRRMPKNPVLWFLMYMAVVLAELMLIFIYTFTPFWHDLIKGPREGMENPKLIAKDARMCFIYSKEDIVISSQDVERHARGAEEKGFKVETHKFVGSSHVSHMRLDEGKYWGVVVNAWATASEGR